MRRIHEIDAVRGLAVCGIVFANVVGITQMPTTGVPGGTAYELLAHQRFFPIFCFLFGVSFALFMESARRRTPHPRFVLMARLGFLIPFGLLHQQLQPHEVLVAYAVAGLAVLLPASFLPRPVVLAAGTVATVAALALAAGGAWLIPGLFLLGLGTAGHSVTRRVPWLFVASLAGALALGAWQLQSGSETVAAVAGLVTATVYASGLLLLLRTPLRRSLSAVFEPLGRMALTNYLTATVLVVAADRMLDLSAHPSFLAVLLFGLAISILLAGLSALWLRRFRYGPAERLWRILTWWRAD